MCLYRKLVGVGGFVNNPVPPEILKEKSIIMTFGGNGFFGYGAYSPSESQVMWWSTYETANLPDNESIDFNDIGRQLRERHKDWKDPIIKDIINVIMKISPSIGWFSGFHNSTVIIINSINRESGW